ncbi:MAG TPA: SHOCT domain-containing protein [Gammaproteobacteria bacterium]|nr:SHOCT domain-containing protein [Chromatiales bacterium]HDK02532.1 SHOCT domain-containing protein [Gammaproteobacteria bacterium]
MGHGFGWMWIFPLIFLLVLVLFVVALLRGVRAPYGDAHGAPPRETAHEILDRRFARGEISKAEYEEMKRTLDG